ncbi:MAG: Ldh family oxidoreductase [Pseudomonadota bacterium]
MKVSYDNLLIFCSNVLKAVGFTKSDADFLAKTLADADAEGHSSHGSYNHLTSYVERVRRSLISLDSVPDIVSDTGSIAVIDGNNGMGQLVSRFAVDIGIKKASKYGTAVVVVRNSNHYGRACIWTEMAAEKGMLGISFTNAGPHMNPTGALEKFVGTNPISIALPAKEENKLVLDMATSVVCMGKIQNAFKEERKIPVGWALDNQGKDTDDPVAALKGSLLPIGGYKGYGLGLMFDVMCSFLSGGDSFDELGGSIAKDFTRPTGTSHYFHFIDISAFQEIGSFKKRVDDLYRRIRYFGDGVYLPGELEKDRGSISMKEGISMPIQIKEDFDALANILKIESIKVI